MKRRLNFDEVKKIELNILLFFDDFCKKNNLKYMLAYGTLLGAVRHGGFIPWDDDIDVMMLRDDYEKMLRLFPHNSQYIMYNYKTLKGYNLPLTKLCDKRTELMQKYDFNEKKELGVNIDIFVIDYYPYRVDKKNEVYYKKAMRKRFYWKLAITKYSNNDLSSIIKRIITVPFKIIGPIHFVKNYDSYCRSKKKGEYAGVLLFGDGFDKEYFYSELFDEITMIEFEGYSFPTISNYDNYLKKIYGNYMELPPENERKIHGFEGYIYE